MPREYVVRTPVEAREALFRLQEQACNEYGCNVFGRLDEAARYAECMNPQGVRRELLALLKFFPPKRKG